MSQAIDRPHPPVSGAPPLAISVRLATSADRPAVLDFASRTWDGWDYIPLVWDPWLAGRDGVLLVATSQPAPGPGRALDRFGRPLDPGRPIALARVTLLAEGEAWLEGLRVEPGVRRRGVATTFQAALLEWARAQGATVVRYATGADNIGSHRLASHHGFEALPSWRTYEPFDPGDVGDAGESDPVGEAGVAEDEPASGAARGVHAAATDARAADGPPSESADDAVAGGGATAPDGPDDSDGRNPERARIVGLLAVSGMRLDPAATEPDVNRWWRRLTADPTVAAGGGLYEGRAWTFQELTRDRFGTHVARGEVLILERGPDTSEGWGVAILSLGPGFVADGRLRTAVVAGDGGAVLEIAAEVERLAGRPLRLRLPDPGPPLLRGHEDGFARAGRVAAEGALHLFGRPLDPGDKYAVPGPPGTLVFGDPPRRMAWPAS
jgi:GNAT superfamily N-acetyltransferase